MTWFREDDRGIIFRTAVIIGKKQPFGWNERHEKKRVSTYYLAKIFFLPGMRINNMNTPDGLLYGERTLKCIINIDISITKLYVFQDVFPSCKYRSNFEWFYISLSFLQKRVVLCSRLWKIFPMIFLTCKENVSRVFIEAQPKKQVVRTWHSW